MEPEHDELISMREKNAKLAKEVQDLRLANSQIIKVQRDNNLLRLKNGRLNNKLMALNSKMHKLLEELDKLDKLALNNIVQCSGHITRSMELRQIHKQECQDLDMLSYRSYGGSPSRVGRVPPQRFMGQCIQPVVSLSRTQLNLHARLVNQNNAQPDGVEPEGVEPEGVEPEGAELEEAEPEGIEHDGTDYNPYVPLARMDFDQPMQNRSVDVNEGDHEEDDVSTAASNASNQEAVMDESHQEEMDQSNLSDSQLEQSRRLDVVMEERTPSVSPRLSSSRSDTLNLRWSPLQSDDVVIVTDPIRMSESEEGTDPIMIPPHSPLRPWNWMEDEEPGGQPQIYANLEADSSTDHWPQDWPQPLSEDIAMEVEVEVGRSPSPVMVIGVPVRTNKVQATSTVTRATASVTQSTAAESSRLTPQNETPQAFTPTMRRRRRNVPVRGHHTPNAMSSRYSPRDLADSPTPVVVMSRMTPQEIAAATTPSRPKSHRELTTPIMQSTSNQPRAQRRSRSDSDAAETSHRDTVSLSPARSDRSSMNTAPSSPPFRGFDELLRTDDDGLSPTYHTNVPNESGEGDKLRRSRRRSVTPGPNESGEGDNLRRSRRRSVTPGPNESGEGDNRRRSRRRSVTPGPNESGEGDNRRRSRRRSVTPGPNESGEGDNRRRSRRRSVTPGPNESGEGDNRRRSRRRSVTPGPNESGEGDNLRRSRRRSVTPGPNESGVGDNLRRSRRRSVTRRCSSCIDEHINTSTRTDIVNELSPVRQTGVNNAHDENAHQSRAMRRRASVFQSRPINDDDNSHANDHNYGKYNGKKNQSNDNVQDCGPSGKKRVAMKFASRRDTHRDDGEPARSRSRQGVETGTRSVSCRGSDSDTSSMSDVDDRRRRQRKPVVTYKEIPLNKKLRR